MPRMYTFNSAAQTQYIFISTVFGHEKLDLHNMMLFSLLDQLDTLKYDYISHYVSSKVLEHMIMMMQFSCYGLSKLVLLYEITGEYVGTPFAMIGNICI